MSGHTSAGKLLSKSGCRYTLLAGNSPISVAGSEEQMHFFQQSSEMFKMASESFIHTLLLFLGLFLRDLHGHVAFESPSLHAICYLFKKLKLVFASIEFQTSWPSFF